MADDRQLDRVSRQVLETSRRSSGSNRPSAMARSTPEFHETARAVDRAARHVWKDAQLEEQIAHDDSPIPEERAEHVPGDWHDTAS